MIYNTTYKNTEAEKIYNDVLGKGFSFIQSIKMGGTGSKRMIIEEVGVRFQKYLNPSSDINYGNIELRKKGIILHFNKGLKTFSWAIPFYKLHTYKANGFSIHADGNFVRFKNNKLLQENRKFIDKIIDLKIKNDKQYEFYTPIN